MQISLSASCFFLYMTKLDEINKEKEVVTSLRS